MFELKKKKNEGDYSQGEEARERKGEEGGRKGKEEGGGRGEGIEGRKEGKGIGKEEIKREIDSRVKTDKKK